MLQHVTRYVMVQHGTSVCAVADFSIATIRFQEISSNVIPRLCVSRSLGAAWVELVWVYKSTPNERTI